jgi:hypothetical protein
VSLKTLLVSPLKRLRVLLVIGAAFGFASCGGGNEPPFDLWDFQAGMPLSELDSIALHDQHERLTCVKSHGSFKSCTITSLGAIGLVQAIVDSSGHAVLVAFKPDLNAIMNYADMQVGLELEARRMRARWNRIAQPHPDPAVRPPARAETWMSSNGRWSARLTWRKDGAAQAFQVADEKALRTWRILADKAEADSMARLATAPVPSAESTDPQVFLDLLTLELKRLVDAQIGYHDMHRDYADDLSTLRFAPRSKISVTIMGADPFGFWARATHALLPGRTCRVYLGEPPRSTLKVRNAVGQPDCSEG